MKCEQYLEQLSPYVDNQLSSSEKGQLEAHLATCKKCAQELEALKKMINLCDQIEEPELPENFHQSLMERIAREKTTEIKKVKFQMKNWMYWGSGLVASVIMGMVWLLNEPILEKPGTMQLQQAESMQMEDAAPFQVSRSMPEAAMEEPKVAMEEPKVATEEPKVAVKEPRVAMEEPKVVMEEPKVVMEEPKVAMEEPRVAMGEPRVAMEEPEVWKVITQDIEKLKKWLDEQSQELGYQMQIVDRKNEITINIMGLLDKKSLKSGLSDLGETEIEVKEIKEGQSVSIVIEK